MDIDQDQIGVDFESRLREEEENNGIGSESVNANIHEAETVTEGTDHLNEKYNDEDNNDEDNNQEGDDEVEDDEDDDDDDDVKVTIGDIKAASGSYAPFNLNISKRGPAFGPGGQYNCKRQINWFGH